MADDGGDGESRFQPCGYIRFQPAVYIGPQPLVYMRSLAMTSPLRAGPESARTGTEISEATGSGDRRAWRSGNNGGVGAGRV